MKCESANCKKNQKFLFYASRLDGWGFGIYTCPYIYKLMKIINKYFIKQLAITFVMLLLVLTGLAWMMQIMTLMKFLLNYGIAVSSFIGLTSLMLPFIINIIIPFTTFIAIIFIYNKLIAENEITVLAASGMSPWQLARPAFIVSGALTIIHFILTLWIVPLTQEKFYATQWELRYGLANMKIQESSFTKLTDDLVVYVDKVAGQDLSKIMLVDTRMKNSETTIIAEKGKLVGTPRGLSIIMDNGSMQSKQENIVIGTFKSFDMDLNLSNENQDESFKVRRISTPELITISTNQESENRQKTVLSEIAKRLFSPLMNLILAFVCVTILLKSSLLRRRFSLAPLIAIGAMAGLMAGFMTATSTITSLTGLIALGAIQIIILAGVIITLIKK